MDVRRGGARPAQVSGVTRRSLLSAGLFGTAAAALGACAVSTAAPDTAPPAGPDLILGANLELSGLNAAVGRDQVAALNIIIKSINQTGFVAGGLTRRVRLATVLDNGSDPNKAAQAMKSLLTMPNLAAVVGSGTGATAAAMAPLSDAAAIPMVAMCSAGALDIELTRRPYIYMLGPRSSDVAVLLASSIGTRFPHAKTIAIVATNDAYGLDGAGAMETALGASSASVTTVHAPSGGTDPTAFAATAKKVMGETPPDVIIVWSLAPTAGNLAQALARAGYTNTLFFDSGAGSDETISGANHSAVLGAFLVAPTILGGPPLAVTDPATLRRRDFYDNYIVANHVFSGFAPSGGDAVLLICQAAVNSNSIEPTDIRDSLETMHYAGIAGSYFFAANNHSGLTGGSLSLFTIAQDGWVPATMM